MFDLKYTYHCINDHIYIITKLKRLKQIIFWYILCMFDWVATLGTNDGMLLKLKA